MPYRLPLTVEESWTGYKLVDADGRTIASAPAYPWHGVSVERSLEFVLESLTSLADAANRQA